MLNALALTGQVLMGQAVMVKASEVLWGYSSVIFININ